MMIPFGFRRGSEGASGTVKTLSPAAAEGAAFVVASIDGAHPIVLSAIVGNSTVTATIERSRLIVPDGITGAATVSGAVGASFYLLVDGITGEGIMFCSGVGGGGNVPLALAVINGTGAISAAVNRIDQLPLAAIIGEGTVTAELGGLYPLVPSTISGSASVAASLDRTRPIVPAAISGTSVVTGEIQSSYPIDPASIIGASTVTVDLHRTRPLSPSAIAGGSSVTADMGGTYPLVPVSIDGAGTITASMGGTYPLSLASITGSSAVTCAGLGGGGTQPLIITSIIGTSAVSASIRRIDSLPVDAIVGSGTVTADLGGTYPLVPAGVTGAAVVTVSVDRTRSLVLGQITGSSVMAAGMGGVYPLTPSSIDGAATLPGLEIDRFRPLAPSSITGTSTVSGLVRRTVVVVPAGIAGGSVVAAEIQAQYLLSVSSIDGEAVVTGAILRSSRTLFLGAIVGEATVASRVDGTHPLSVDGITGTSSVTAGVDGTHLLIPAAITGTAVVVGDLHGTYPLDFPVGELEDSNTSPAPSSGQYIGWSTNRRVAWSQFTAGDSYDVGKLEATITEASGDTGLDVKAVIFTDSSSIPGTQVGGESSTVPSASFTTTEIWYEFTFSNAPSLTSGTTYWIGLIGIGTTDATNFLWARRNGNATKVGNSAWPYVGTLGDTSTTRQIVYRLYSSAGGIVGDSTVTGSFNRTRLLVPASISGDATVTTSVGATHPLLPAAIVGTSVVTASMGGTYPLILSSIAGSATVTCAGIGGGGTQPLVTGPITGASSVTAAIRRIESLPVPAMTGAAIVTAELNGIYPLSIDAITGAASASGALLRIRPVGVDAIVGGSSITAELGGTYPLSLVDIEGTSAVTADLGGVYPLSIAAITGQATVTGTLKRLVELEPASIAGAATVTCSKPSRLRGVVPAAIIGTSSVSGWVGASHPLTPASIIGTSAVTGALDEALHLAAIIGGSVVTAEVHALHPLVPASITGVGVVTGDLLGRYPLALASISGSASVTGAVARDRPALIVTAIVGTSSVTCDQPQRVRRLDVAAVVGGSVVTISDVERERAVVPATITGTSTVTGVVTRAARWLTVADTTGESTVTAILGKRRYFGPETAVIVVWDKSNIGLYPVDQDIIDYMEEKMGLTVTVVDDGDAADTTKDVVVISSSVNSGSVGTKYTAFTGGIITWERLLADELEMGTSVGSYATTQVDVVNNDHYITDHFSSGTNTVFTTSESIHSISLAYGTELVGRISSTETVLAIAEKGETSSGGTFDGRRCYFIGGDASFDSGNADLVEAFAKALTWSNRVGYSLTVAQITGASTVTASIEASYLPKELILAQIDGEATVTAFVGRLGMEFASVSPMDFASGESMEFASSVKNVFQLYPDNVVGDSTVAATIDRIYRLAPAGVGGAAVVSATVGKSAGYWITPDEIYGAATVSAVVDKNEQYGYDPDLGLTTTWTGVTPSRDEYVDTDTNRSTFMGIHSDLLALDIGNSVPTNADQKFSGGTVTQWYVTTGGSDSGDGSSGSPWASLHYAYQQVPATPTQNYQINIGEGVFKGVSSLSNKTINAPYYVRIVGAGPEATILTYTQTEINAAITAAEGVGYVFGTHTTYLADAHYDPVITLNDEQVEIRGLRIVGARNLLPQYKYSECGIWMQHTSLASGEKIILADLEISQTGHVGIKGGSTGGTIIVDGVSLHDNGHSGNDHHLYPTADGFEIRRSLFVNTDGVGINGNDSDRQNEIITHNIFIGCEQGVAVAGKDWTVDHNIFYRNNSGGLKLYRAGVGGQGRNNVFYENVDTVTAKLATTADTSGDTGIYPNRPHFGFAFDYNYVETGSTVDGLTMTMPTDVELWSATTDYTKMRTLRTTAGRYYEMKNYTAGNLSGASEPTAESSWTTGITDGDNTLRYLGTDLATNTYTNTTTGDDSAEAVFVDADGFDFLIKPVSDAILAGQDLGYANGTLVGVWTTDSDGSSYVGGVKVDSLYSGYWNPPVPVQHYNDSDEPDELIAQYDPLQSTLGYYDVVANRSNILAQLDLLRTEWDTASQKYSGSFTNTLNVSWTLGNDATGNTSGNKFKTVQGAVTYIIANHVDGSDLLDAATEIVMETGIHYIEAYGGNAQNMYIYLSHITGTATKPLVIRSATGDMKDVILRYAHDDLAANFDDWADNTIASNGGIWIHWNSDYIEVWDITIVGPMYEHAAWELDGQNAGVTTQNYNGGGHNKVIHCELTQWPHCGLKGHGLDAYGNYVHTNGVTSHDHGFYVSEQSPDQQVVGNVWLNSFGLSVVAREGNTSTGLEIVGNIMGYQALWVDGSGAHVFNTGGIGAVVAHNVILPGGEDWVVLMGGQARNNNYSNNVFFSTAPLAIESNTNSDYDRPAGYQWVTNAKLSTRSAPTVSSGPEAWATGQTVTSSSNCRESNGHNYMRISGTTTGSTAPTHTDGSDVSDGGVVWRDIGTDTLSYGTFTDISSTAVVDYAGFDFRPAVGSDLLSNGTDLDYVCGSTIGMFANPPGYVGGVKVSSLFEGYWIPPSAVQHLELNGTDAHEIADYDPQQSTLETYDTIANRTGILATVERLRTEWSTSSEKFSGTFVNSYYVDWDNGNDTTGTGTTGSPWKTMRKAIAYIEANDKTGDDLDDATEIVLKEGIHYIDANPARSNTAVVNINDMIGTATKPLVIRGETGDMGDVLVRIDHSYLNTHFSGWAAGTTSCEMGIRMVNNTSFVEVWDMTLVGPLYEAAYKDGGGNQCGVFTYNVEGDNNKVIGCEITAWGHCGLKGAGLSGFGNFIHSIGVSGHDHGHYQSNQSSDQKMIGNIILNCAGLTVMPRQSNDSTGVEIKGNIMGHSALWDGTGAHIGTYGGINPAIAHNIFLPGNEDWVFLLTGYNRNMDVYNNVFLGSAAITAYGVSGDYIHPVGYVFETNGKLSTRSAPSGSNPPSAWASGETITYQDNCFNGGRTYCTFSPFSGTTAVGSEPVHTNGGIVTGADNVPWFDLGVSRSESWGTWTNVSDSDFYDRDNFDFRPAPDSSLLTNGTDNGDLPGDTIGPFAKAFEVLTPADIDGTTTVTAAVGKTSGSSTWGIDSALSGEAGIGNNRVCFLTFTASEAGTVQSVTAYLKSGNTSAQNIKCSLYDHDVDNPGWPDTYIDETEVINVPNNSTDFAWYTFDFDTPVSVSSGDRIDIGMHCSGSIRFKYQLSVHSPHEFYYNMECSYTTPDDPIATSGNRYADGGLSIYVTYT